MLFPISLTIQYFSPIFLSILVAQKMKVRFDAGIAEFYTGAICGLFLRKIGLVKKVAYYVSDWFPYQPKGKLRLATYIMNSIAFPYLDRFCARRADTTWNFTQRIIDARHDRWKRHPLIVPREEVISPPLTWRKIADDEDDCTKHKSVGFLGVLRKGQGLELAIESIANLKKQGINLNLEIVGTSSNEKYFKDYAAEFSVDDRVIFHGFVKDEIKVAKILRRCICGLALYKVGKENYTYYTWPSKVGFYLECGVPVLITKSTAVAEDVKEKKMGIVVESNLKSVSQAIKTLASNPKLYEEYRQNATKYVQKRASGKDLTDSIERLI